MNIIWTPQPRQKEFMKRREHDTKYTVMQVRKDAEERKCILHGRTHEKTPTLLQVGGGSIAVTAGS